MKTPSYEEIRQHPELREEIVRAAHRQRAEAVSQLITRLIAWLVAALTTQPKPLRKSRWLAVHHGS
jgi:hypothetical protein